MTEPVDSTTQSADPSVARRTVDSDGRDRRLRHALAWVGIVTGVVITVAVIFFSGFGLGRASGGHYGWHRGFQSGQMGPADCPMMRNGGMKGPGGMMGPGGMDPDDMGPGMMRPGQSPGTSAPPTPR